MREHNTKKLIPILAITLVVTVAGITFTTNLVSHNDTEVITIHSALPNYSVDYLAKETRHAIIGEVVSITPAGILIDDAHSSKIVFSDVVIDVEKDLNGEYKDRQITVKIRGGSLDGVQVISDSDPQFSIGERVLIFVGDKEPESIWGDSYYVAGLELGKYSLSNGKAYGAEHPTGLDEASFVSKIKEARMTR